MEKRFERELIVMESDSAHAGGGVRIEESFDILILAVWFGDEELSVVLTSEEVKQLRDMLGEWLVPNDLKEEHCGRTT